MSIKQGNLLATLVILLGFLVRVWGIDFGLPDKHIIDETEVIYTAFYAGANNLKPLRFEYSPFVSYILLAEYSAYFVLGRLLGYFATAPDLFVNYISDPTIFLLLGRLTMVLAGTATVWILWLVGNKFFNRRIGLIGSLLLSLSFLHAKESHYLKRDTLAAFFVLASFYFAIRILRGAKIKDYILAGVFSALSLGAKYYGSLIIPIVLIAHLLRKNNLFSAASLRKLASFIFATFLTFSVINPYFVLDFKNTAEAMIADFATGRVVYRLHLLGKPVWWWFTTQHIPQGLGWPLFLVGVAGFLICLWRGHKGDRKYFLIPLLPIIFLVSIDFWTKFHFARYALMTLPFFVLSASVFLDEVANRLKTRVARRVFLTIAVTILVFQPFLRIIKFDYLLTRPDTRPEAKEWIEENILAGSKILVESTIRPEQPSNLNVALNLNIESIDKRISAAESYGYPATYLKHLRTVNLGEIGYDIIVTPRIDYQYDIINSQAVRLENIDYYLKDDVEYLVLTSWARRPRLEREFKQSIASHYSFVKEFRPNPQFPVDPHFIQVDFQELDNVSIFDKNLVFGPKISIYKLR